mmetsp:Transcript_10415/g.30226  ORF Transcript_10415/g.30226 Transcript_10415/m.30226 type:complete len:212 (-) Transcript_10415:284-919(-)
MRADQIDKAAAGKKSPTVVLIRKNPSTTGRHAPVVMLRGRRIQELYTGAEKSWRAQGALTPLICGKIVKMHLGESTTFHSVRDCAEGLHQVARAGFQSDFHEPLASGGPVEAFLHLCLLPLRVGVHAQCVGLRLHAPLTILVRPRNLCEPARNIGVVVETVRVARVIPRRLCQPQRDAGLPNVEQSIGAVGLVAVGLVAVHVHGRRRSSIV